MTDGRDARGGFFQIDNAVVDHYLPRVGDGAFAVYAYLVRRMDTATRTAWPSYTTIQERTGKGRGQVAAALKKLVDHGLIRIESGDARTVNRYHILPVGSSPAELVPNQNYPQSDTSSESELVPERNRCSSPAELELVPNQNRCSSESELYQDPEIKTQVSRPRDQDPVPTGKSESPPRTRARTSAPVSRFSPEHPELTDAHRAEAAKRGWPPDALDDMTDTWALRRAGKSSGIPWVADWTAFGKDFFKREPQSRGSPGGPARAPSTAKYEPEAINDTLAELREARRSQDHGHGGEVRRRDGPPDAGLREPANGEAGGVPRLSARVVR